MNSLALSFWLHLIATPILAQTLNGEEPLLYDTSGGRDFWKTGGQISFAIPMRFYGDRFTTIFAHRNGYVTFADEKVWSPGYFRDNKLIAPCMVEIKDNYNLGIIRFLVTSEEYLLNRATVDVTSHFVTEADFKAHQVVIIEWNGLLSQETTIQSVIIVGKKKTFALFLFRNKNGKSFGNAIRNLDAQSGFSNGDKIKYTELLDFRANRNIESLFKSSNTMKAGKWIFLIGFKEEELFQVQMPDSYPVYDESKGKITRKDIDECQERISVCHRFADCFNTVPGYNCICSRTYYGNGRTCLREYVLINIEGKITGVVNDINVGVGNLVALISQSRGELFVTIDSISSVFGHSFQMVPPLAGLLGWIFGKSVNGKTGYDIVGNRFKSTSIIIFKTGEILHIKQEMRRFDSFNNLIFDTEVNGTMPVPLTTASSIQSIKPYTEKYALGDNKKIYSEGSATYIVDDNSIDYTVSRAVDFETVNSNTEYTASVEVKDTTSVFYDSNSHLRFRQKYTVTQEPAEGIPKVSTTERPRDKTTNEAISILKQKTSRPATKTVKIAEIRTQSSIFTKEEPSDDQGTIPRTMKATKSDIKQTSISRNLTSPRKELGAKTESFRSEESTQSMTPVAPTRVTVSTVNAEKTIHKTTVKPVETPQSKAKPVCFTQCSENAECKNVNGQNKCICKEGFIGNGTSCKVDRRIDCGTYKCDENSECINEQSQYFCKCRAGYIGNGVKCYVDVPCKCHINAECYNGNEGEKICVCKLGFTGNGKRCKDIDECRDMRIMCQPNSKCKNTFGSYECLCNKGFRKNGTKCLDIPECTEQKHACGERAICTERPGSYHCRCPQGFHFGNKKRDCFPDCPRCLNGGTCVGRFGCKCAPGYSGEICQWVGDEFLLYGQGGNVKRFSYPYGPMSYGYIYRDPITLMVGVDYDCQDKKVYWTDIISGNIQRANFNGTSVKVVANGLIDPQGLTVDWLGRNIFWTDNGKNSIHVSKIDGKLTRTLHSERITNPRPIICNPYTGQLFWADWDRATPRIEVSSMDGSNRKILVSNGIGLPNGLTIDYKAGELCWTDAEMRALSCIGLDGRNQRELTKLAGYPFGITIHDSVIYWTNWDTDNIGKFDKKNKKTLREVRSGFGSDGRLFDIKSVSACPARKNVCAYENGGCDGLCLMKTDGTRACA